MGVIMATKIIAITVKKIIARKSFLTSLSIIFSSVYAKNIAPTITQKIA